MKNTKIIRLIALALCLALAVSTVACKKKAVTPPSAPPSTPSVEQEKEPELTGTDIVRDGESDYTVVIPAAASAVERNAANELVKFIRQSTGAELPIVTDTEATDATGAAHYISVGETQLYEAQSWNADDLATDGFIVKTVGKTLFIIGEAGRSTLYGVYDFLEKEVGCRFLSPTYDHVPARDEIPLRKLDVREEPAFPFRSNLFYPLSYNEDYAAKMRFYSKQHMSAEKVDKIGGDMWVYWSGGYHSCSDWVDWDTYSDEHRDWFSNIGTKQKWQWCYSNGLNDDGTLAEGDTLLNTVVQKITDYCVSHPTIEYITIGEKDAANPCECAKCQAQVEALGGVRSAQVMLMVNAIAREVKANLTEMGKDEKYIGNLKFIATAYTWSLNPPVKQDENGNFVALSEKTVPRDDVYIYVAPIDGCYMHALNDEECTVNASGVNYFYKGWRAIFDRVLMFDYLCDFRDYLVWYPNINILQANVRYFREMGVTGVLSEGTITGQNYYETDLVSYLLSKLTWDPDVSVTELRAEYDRCYFGEAAGPIITEYTDFMNAHYEEVSRQGGDLKHARVYTELCTWILSMDTCTEQFINKAIDYLARADAAIDADQSLTAEQKEQYHFNVEQARLQPYYMKYKNYDQNFSTGDEEKYRFMTEFWNLIEKHDINNYREGGNLGDLKALMFAGLS